METHAATHPTPGELAAFIDGTLPKDKRARVLEHLADCQDCYDVFAETAWFLEDHPEVAARTGDVVPFPSAEEGRPPQHPVRRLAATLDGKVTPEQAVKVKPIEDDYGALRKFAGLSSMETYLRVVVQNLMLDHRNHLLGKWRPSSEASRLGEVAVRLEELAGRGRLPPRTARRMEGEEAFEDLSASRGNIDQRVLGKEREEKRKNIEATLSLAMAQLSGEDQLIVRLRERFSTAEIARLLDLDQKQLYRQVSNILKTLRKALEEQGIHREDVADILDWEDL